MDGIIRIVKSQEDSGTLIDGAIDRVKHEIEKQDCGLFGAMTPPLAVLLIAPMVSSLRQPLLAFISITFNRKGFGKKDRKNRKRIYDMKHMDKNF